MDVKLKAVAAAVALAISGAASASAIAPDGLYFSAYDLTNNTSIVVNLGETAAQFRANPSAPISLAGDGLSGLTAFLGSADLAATRWTVLAITDDGTGANVPPSNLYGGLSTSTNITTVYPDWGSFGGLDATVTGNVTYLNLVNNHLGSSNYWTTSGQDAFHFAGQDGGVGFEGTTTGLGAMAFYSFFADPTNSYFGGAFTTFPGTWTLTADSLSYLAGTAVPLPAAVWLFGSGLLGLAGIGRRKAIEPVAA
jgi:hypothetical protein